MPNLQYIVFCNPDCSPLNYITILPLQVANPMRTLIPDFYTA